MRWEKPLKRQNAYCVYRIVVLFSHSVRGHRTGSSHSGGEEYLGGKKHKPKVVKNAYITADAIHSLRQKHTKVIPGVSLRCIRFILVHTFNHYSRLKNRLLNSCCICCTVFPPHTHLLSSFWTSKLWSQMSSLPPGTCLQFLSRIGFGIPTARRFSSSVANSRSRAFHKSICAQEKVPTNLDYTSKNALGGIRTHETLYQAR